MRVLTSKIMLTDNPTPQFGTAEYASSDSDRCKACNQTLGSTFYRINGAVTCSYCAEQTKLRIPVDSHSTFVRALLFGIGGAILGLVIYSGFGILTGLMVGYISLAVGYIVGKAMMKGSNGIGRSEEHTSELQSPCNLVCRLLLEKKKDFYCDIVCALHNTVATL